MAHTSPMLATIRREFSPRSLVGLGQTAESDLWQSPWSYVPAVNIALRTAPYIGGSGRAACEYPWYCDILGQWNRAFDSCKPFTDAELRACQAADFGPAMTPEAGERALRLGDESVAAYCRMHPDECSAYQQALADPNADLKFYAWIAGGVLALVLVVSLMKGRR